MSVEDPLLKLDALATCDEGMVAAETKLDWSHKPHSKRTDRVLSPEDTLRFSQKSNLKGCQYYFGNMALMGLNAYVIKTLIDAPPSSFSPVAYVALAFLILWQGFSIAALGFAGQHECIHFTAFASIRLNKVFMFLCSLPAISFAEHEMLLHRDHHTFTGIVDKDTELIDWGDMSYKNGFRKVPSTVGEYWWWFLSLTWETARNRMRKLGYCAMGHPVDYTCTAWKVDRDVDAGNPSIRSRLQWWARLHISFYMVFLPPCVYFVGVRLMFWCWLLPWFVGPAVLWFIQIAEHADCTRDENGLTNTRTVDLNPVVRFVYWNMNYHAEHHLYPTFPFHHLHDAHLLLKSHFAKTCDSFAQLNYRVVTEYIPKQIADLPVTADKS